MGCSDGQITKIRLSESVGIMILSLLILLLFGLLNIANLLRINFIEYAIWSYVFPISMFVVFNWLSICLVLFFLGIISISLVFILSLQNKIVDIADILRTEYQEGVLWEGIN